MAKHISHSWLLALLISQTAYSDIIPEKIFTAQTRKLNTYTDDGMIVGGHRSINHVIIKGIRHAENKDFDRIVIDLEGTRAGESAAIPRPPYFQASIDKMGKTVVLHVWGRPELAFDSSQLHKSFSGSTVIEKITLYPPELEEEIWTSSISLYEHARIEIFELTEPTRIIIDIQKKKE